MLFTIQVNNKKIKAEKGETILSALNRNGIIIPTLCRMKEFTPTGACRMCVVEVEGRERLVTACSQPVEEWMKIKTHSPRVIQARKTIVELLLSNHPDDCLYCDRNLNCELQRLSEELNIPDRFEVLVVLALGKPVEKVVLEDIKDNDVKYWRDSTGTHHVPKRGLNELIVKF